MKVGGALKGPVPNTIEFVTNCWILANPFYKRRNDEFVEDLKIEFIVVFFCFQHPWLECASDKAALTTPAIIKKNNSARELSQFAESAMAVNRVVQQHFSMKLDYLEVYPDQKERGSPQYSGHLLGLSPPSESDLMRRRLKGRSCQFLLQPPSTTTTVAAPAAQAITSLSG